MLKTYPLGNPLVVQWLRLGTFTAMGPGLTPGRGSKILHATPKKKKKSPPDHQIIINNR